MLRALDPAGDDGGRRGPLPAFAETSHSAPAVCAVLWPREYYRVTSAIILIHQITCRHNALGRMKKGGRWGLSPALAETPHSAPGVCPCYGRENITVSRPPSLFYQPARHLVQPTEHLSG